MNAATPLQTPPGWYGKLPFLGDFANRRLPTDFVNAWDDWLQQVIHGSRTALGEEAWLQRYLSSPLWHFCLAPGLCGPQAWFGLIMSSVDRANRHFPFTIAHGVAPEGLHDVSLPSLVDWLGSLDGEAIAMLDLQGSVQAVEERLALYPVPGGLDDTRPRVAEDLSACLGHTTRVASSEVPSLLAAVAEQATRGGSAISLWWTSADDDGHGAIVRACNGLPSADDYTAMIGGG